MTDSVERLRSMTAWDAAVYFLRNSGEFSTTPKPPRAFVLAMYAFWILSISVAVLLPFVYDDPISPIAFATTFSLLTATNWISQSSPIRTDRRFRAVLYVIGVAYIIAILATFWAIWAVSATATGGTLLTPIFERLVPGADHANVGYGLAGLLFLAGLIACWIGWFVARRTRADEVAAGRA
jgi:hypothetical protein